MRAENAEKIARLLSTENRSAGWLTRAGRPSLTPAGQRLSEGGDFKAGGIGREYGGVRG
ncbi:hypothetical protein ACQ4WX_02075 [Streptomyces lasalocidi]